MKPKWYTTNKRKILLTLLIPPLALYFMWKYAPWQRETKWRVTTAFLVLVLLIQPFMYMDKSYDNTPSKQSTSTVQVANTSLVPALESVQPEATTESTPAPQQKTLFEIKERIINSTVENYMVLISSADDGEKASIEVKKQCSKPCNITLFDNEQALNLQKEYDKMSGSFDTSPSQLTAWKEKNYIFVADHLVGYVTFDTGEYLEYPYKDWYYKKLKANN